MGLSTDPGAVHLDAGLVGLPRLGRGLALLRLVLSCPVQTQRAFLTCAMMAALSLGVFTRNSSHAESRLLYHVFPLASLPE